MATFSMTPAAGEKCLRFVGDRLRFTLRTDAPLPAGWTARLRTDLGRAATLRSQIIHSHFRKLPLAGAQWHDVPMQPDGDGGWFIELTLAEVGYFRAKAYAIDEHGKQHWPDGKDVGVTVHPDRYRTANTIYCAFVRQFGENRTLPSTDWPGFEARLNHLDRLNYNVIPPSGKLRDLIRQLPHIVDTLGCRILHLLPINPTPTVKARFGRFGSPYASQDLLAIDPALVEHENATTGLDQFRELAYATHALGARLFIDLAINHTGWGSTLQEEHPEWFLHDEKTGEFVSPGAWGVTWGDLVELEQTHVALWEHLAGVFLEWCRRGVDGFRCDAGYKVPMPAWQYITARVREEFPDALFLLEGLGGAWDLTENLLGDGGMQWAYSELFQEFSGSQVQGYLDHAHKQSARIGPLVHYSETHDNLRLAAAKPDGRAWSLLRNRLSALTSVCGGFAFTNGVEWLAKEKVIVHQASGLNWGAEENIIPELTRLNQLLAEHPCFFDGAKLTRLSPPGSPVYALRRDSADGKDSVLVLVNLDEKEGQSLALDAQTAAEVARFKFDLLKQHAVTGVKISKEKGAAGETTFELPPAAVFCWSVDEQLAGYTGELYRLRRAQAAWAVQQLCASVPSECIGAFDWLKLAEWASENPERFLAAVSAPGGKESQSDLLAELSAIAASGSYRPVVSWTIADRTRVFLAPPRHWLLVRDPAPFRVMLRHPDGKLRHAESLQMGDEHVASFAPQDFTGDAELAMERYDTAPKEVRGTIRFLAAELDVSALDARSPGAVSALEDSVALLTNGLGGMARLGVDFGAIRSKYDCALGANLHDSVPVDRHVFVKRVRVWCGADGFVAPLNANNLVAFAPGPPARWSFVANAGDGRSVLIEITADMLAGHNTTVFHLSRPAAPPPTGRELPPACDVRLIVRVDLEDRGFHSETQRNGGSEQHFRTHSHRHSHGIGFAFTPAADRQLHVIADAGHYHHEEEWSHCAHPVEVTRGQTGEGDAFSPGWFELPMKRGTTIALTLTAHPHSASAQTVSAATGQRAAANQSAIERAGFTDGFGKQLALAAQSFVVRRDDGKTVIAGYPWFLDWGRDSLICARGLLAAGMREEVLQLLKVFGRFEADGTLPNTIHGENASNRDTTDAPLWYGVVCEDAAATNDDVYRVSADKRGRTIADVLRSIAVGYLRGTPNGICVDADSGLVWSPSHFTWMDTNFPAGTPREGYPVEIQVLWIRLLRQLERIGAKPEGKPWAELAARAEKSFQQLFWLADKGWFADVLLAKPRVIARDATPDDALRSNMLFAVSLGLVTGERARRCVEAAAKWLVVPGALRSLAPLEVSVPLEIRANNGGDIINDPPRPYWPRYEGEEDTRRKPAYHNGTAWTWTFPTFCEALALAHGSTPEAVAAARAYLGSADKLMTTGCAGQIPEILDGDAPHTQRGCDAQAWGVTETLRVWKLLNP
ncbi:MAG: glycogen debranching enzyme N-terminal domain-containing protein [Verrucomicrobia bacterium]|nr:glycogen debranching enzyme N-terminal domain-containing protein [Verrucomicrobiota bacterium]